MQRQRGWEQSGVVGRAHRLQQPLAAQQLERHRVAVHQIDFVPPRLRFGHGALQDFLRRGAPGADFHAVFLFECRVQHRDIFGGKRRIQAEKALATRAFQQALMTVDASVRSQSRERAPRLLRLNGRSETRDCEQGAQGFHALDTVFAGSFCAIATASDKLSSRDTTIDTARAPCAAGSRPGGASPRSTALAASISRLRVLTMPLSEETRCSRLRSWIVPMLSCMAASWTPTSSTPEKVFFAFCAPRSIR